MDAARSVSTVMMSTRVTHARAVKSSSHSRRLRSSQESRPMIVMMIRFPSVTTSVGIPRTSLRIMVSADLGAGFGTTRFQLLMPITKPDE